MLLTTALLVPSLPDVTYAQGTSVEDEIRQQLDTDANVQNELRQAEKLARGESEEIEDCGKFLGLCWYFSVPSVIIAVVILGLIFGKRRD